MNEYEESISTLKIPTMTLLAINVRGVGLNDVINQPTITIPNGFPIRAATPAQRAIKRSSEYFRYRYGEFDAYLGKNLTLMAINRIVSRYILVRTFHKQLDRF